MKPEENYLEINRKSWNDKTDAHLKSDFYNLDGFINGETSLNDIELALLGDIEGKTILHLQCHFGQDSISLQRMGAQVTGVDLSDKAIEEARKLAAKTGNDTQFIASDIFDLPNNLSQKFDIVFTSYGTIGWLPDINKWAKVVSHFLKPKGKFVFAEFHPVVWMFDDDLKGVAYNYFKDEAIVEDESGTYADKNTEKTHQNITWNHALSEVVSALLSNSIEIKDFKEYDYSPYNIFSDAVEIAPKKYRVKHFGNKFPIVYSLVGKKTK